MKHLDRLLALFVVFLTSCAPFSQQSITTSQTKEQSASPSISSSTPSIQPTIANTSTLVPPPTSRIPTQSNPKSTTLDEIDQLNLESILLQPGDLPDGYAGGEVSETIPGYMDLQGGTCEYRMYQGFKLNNVAAGGVTLLVCSEQPMYSIAYDMGVWGSRRPEVQDIGDYMVLGTLEKSHKQAVEGKNILFNRCNAVVYIRLTGTVGQEIILSYAKKLDERLTPLFCITTQGNPLP